MNALLAVEGVTVRFGGILAVSDVSFTLAPGELLGLIGPNGAGKTTMLRTITGVVRPAAGRIALDGREVTTLTTDRRVRMGLALTNQIVRPLRSMSVLDNVAIAAGHARTASVARAAFARGRGAEHTRARELLRLVGIEHHADAAPAALPLGALKRLEVARALALDPKLLLLDEPLAGLNQAEAETLADTIVALNRGGLSMILIEHNLAEVMRTCPRLVVLDNGRLIGAGETRAVLSDPHVVAAYIGKEDEDAAA